MNILKDRAIWIVVVVMILAGGIYIIVINKFCIPYKDVEVTNTFWNFTNKLIISYTDGNQILQIT